MVVKLLEMPVKNLKIVVKLLESISKKMEMLVKTLFLKIEIICRLAKKQTAMKSYISLLVT